MKENKWRFFSFWQLPLMLVIMNGIIFGIISGLISFGIWAMLYFFVVENFFEGKQK